MRTSTMVLAVLLVTFFGSAPAEALSVGSNLTAIPNGSVCEFQSLEPTTRVCTLGQRDLLADHTASGGLVAPVDGVIVRWSILSGTALPGTGVVKLALRTMRGPGYIRKGPEVDLLPSPPGTRHTYPERMSIGAGQPIGVTIAIANRNTQEAGAPIAFREGGIGTIDTWTGEPLESIWGTEEDVELLLDAEIEPDADHDGYGDLTQDLCPDRYGSGEFCAPRDRDAPTIQLQFTHRQAFLRSGAILVRAASNEAGRASAEGRLEVKGRDGRTYWLRGVRRPVVAGGRAALHLRIQKRTLKAVRAAVRGGKKILVTVRVGVVDAAGNERQATAQIRPR